MTTPLDSHRRKFDPASPGAQELRDKIVHGAFVTEGTMIAFPTCFPAVTLPVPADESRITALDATADGIVYAGTSGRATHLLVGMFHGVTGMVFDMGVVDGANRCAALCCGKNIFAAAVNGPAGGRMVLRAYQPLPFDLIQEWHIARTPFEYLAPVAHGQDIIHALATATRELVVGVTDKHLFTLHLESRRIDLHADIPGKGRLAHGATGSIFGPDEHATLWRFDPVHARLERAAIPLPGGSWDLPRLSWARDDATGALYTADAAGSLFRFDDATGFSGPLARIPHLPVGPMAVTRDGRLFGFAGEGMARLFCFDPLTAQVADLGVAVSVIERRRYGYSFADAVVGRDGEIVFAEDDDLGHLWLYFPRIRNART